MIGTNMKNKVNEKNENIRYKTISNHSIYSVSSLYKMLCLTINFICHIVGLFVSILRIQCLPFICYSCKSNHYFTRNHFRIYFRSIRAQHCCVPKEYGCNSFPTLFINVRFLSSYCTLLNFDLLVDITVIQTCPGKLQIQWTYYWKNK